MESGGRSIESPATAFIVIFLAEWGDLTQLATAAQVARLGHPIPIAIGAFEACQGTSC